MSGNESLPDTDKASLAARLSPGRMQAFAQLARLDRPIGWQLLLAPCWWSSALASVARPSGPAFGQLLLLALGAIVMRGAGSTYNDIIDRHIDAGVERTRNRPLPSGRVSPKAAAAFMVVQALVGLAILLSFNRFTIVLGIASLAIVAVYPFMKRITSWPQFVLGLAFAWGGLMGWAGQMADVALPSLALYAAAIAWTIGYDTIYALQDSRDDAIMGVRSTARLFSGRVRMAVARLYALAVLLAALALERVGTGLFGWLGLAAFAGHLGWQVTQIDEADGPGALRLFRANRDAGFLLFFGLLVQALMVYI